MDIAELLRAFSVQGACTECTPLSGGTIHGTYLIVTDAGDRYVLQEMHGFDDPAAVMENIARVTEHLRRRFPEERTLHFYCTDGGWLYEEKYRLMDYLPGRSLTDAPEHLETAGFAFGRFAAMVSDVGGLTEPISGFHDTRKRLETLRTKSVPQQAKALLCRLLALGEDACALCDAQKAGTLPTRVVHGDTKSGNVLVDADGRAAVIDLDTVMPGLIAYDYGDGIRSAAAKGRALDAERFYAFTRGYLRGMPDVTDAELESLTSGIFCVTAELAMRYLTDLADGCVYFRKTPQQTMERAETLTALAVHVRENEYRLCDEVHRIRQEML